MTIQKTISPIDGSVYVERGLARRAEIDQALAAARKASQAWREVPLDEPARLLNRAVDHFVAPGPAIAEAITRQMGRPIGHSPGQAHGLTERARLMVAIPPHAP